MEIFHLRQLVMIWLENKKLKVTNIHMYTSTTHVNEATIIPFNHVQINLNVCKPQHDCSQTTTHQKLKTSKS